MPEAEAVHSLSAVGLFLQADPIVKGVMLLLILASVACWAIVIEKAVAFGGLKRRLSRFEAEVASGEALRVEPIGATSMEHAPTQDLPQAILHAGFREWRADSGEEMESRSDRRDRLERAMRATLGIGLRRLETKLPLLATVGSAGPFIGLFGTVWGIMHSFTSIAQTNDTSLAVVAPGIAEALFATAIGLVAAIPAVVAYNKLTVDLGRIAERLRAAISDLGNQMSRRPAARVTPVRGVV